MSSSFSPLLISLAALLPMYAVWMVAIIVALVRWQRHPHVSAIVIVSLAGLLLLSIIQRIGNSLILDEMLRGGQRSMSAGVYFSILNLVSMFVRTAAWAAILVALFGWRPMDLSEKARRLEPFQFSIRSLMIATLGVALLCGLIRGLVFVLGERAAFLIGLIGEVPLIVCWLIGIWIAISRWSAHPAVSKLAIIGFSVNFGIILLWHVCLSVITSLLMVELAGVLGFATSILTAIAWSLILTAALGWREKVDAPDKSYIA